MNKQEEIQALRNFINSLPKETYLYDSLSESFETIKANILSDFPAGVAESIQDIETRKADLNKEIIDLEKLATTKREVIFRQDRTIATQKRVFKEIEDKANGILFYVK